MEEFKALVRSEYRKQEAWFDFPIMPRTIRDCFSYREDEIDDPLEIVEYIAPFSIKEKLNVDRFNQICLLYEGLPSHIRNATKELLERLSDWEIDWEIDDLAEKAADIDYFDVDTDFELGDKWVDEYYGTLSNLPPEDLREFFDFQSFASMLKKQHVLVEDGNGGVYHVKFF